MLRQLLNWRTALAIVAILIVSGTIFYSQYLARKIAKEEKQKVEQWIEAGKFLIISPADADTRLASMILTENKSIPIIETDELDNPIVAVNLDSAKIANDSNYLKRKVKQFKSIHNPIEWVDPKDPKIRNLYYYGDSKLLNEVRYYPIIQLAIVALFIIITVFSIRSSYRSTQNQVWAGMAKETAHQLGTPVSSLEGWVEMLKEKSGNEKIVQELSKDVDRLRLVSDRFGKIGSTPQLEEIDLVSQIKNMVDYMKKRAAGKINFSLDTHGQQQIMGKVSAPLFDWVIENLLKNALDAMDGKGSIAVDINDDPKEVCIDIADSGKGISKQNIARVFKPGFTTKKRGWGLGLSLSRRIIEQYHKGQIFVKQSETGKGTTFRIVLKK
ncbi:MAG TPA: HAMP domain-containing sensor histidine kinase [Chitinophagaceae bacterium]|jgi:K+-sensing histidine kinase KdpD|nr:HAMP domain-containing sensor histidine kinase [Chitinophagaceae bacterium]